MTAGGWSFLRGTVVGLLAGILLARFIVGEAPNPKTASPAPVGKFSGITKQPREEVNLDHVPGSAAVVDPGRLAGRAVLSLDEDLARMRDRTLASFRRAQAGRYREFFDSLGLESGVQAEIIRQLEEVVSAKIHANLVLNEASNRFMDFDH